jgi:hypothetical protein
MGETCCATGSEVNACRLLVGRPEEKGHSEDLGVNEYARNQLFLK